MDIMGWMKKTGVGSSDPNAPATPGVLNGNGSAFFPDPPHQNGALPSPQRIKEGKPHHLASSLNTQLEPMRGPASALSGPLNLGAATSSIFGVAAPAVPVKEEPKVPVRRGMLRIRVATSVGTLLIPALEDSTIARLLAEAHARLGKEDDENQEQRQVFTTARSVQGDFIDVSDLVGDILSNGETIIGLTDLESRYAPKDIHPIFSAIMEKAVADPFYHQMKARRPRESAEVFIVSKEDDDAPVPPSKIDEEDEEGEDEITDLKVQVVNVDDLKFVARRSSVRPGRRLSAAQGSGQADQAAIAAAAAAAFAAKPKSEEPQDANSPALSGEPARTVDSAVAGNLLEVLTRTPHPTKETASVLAWVPCIIEVVGEGDDEGFMQVRFLEGDRVEVVGVERLRAIQKTDLGGESVQGGDVEVLVKNENEPDQYIWFPATIVSYGVSSESSTTVSVRLQTTARVATEADDENIPLVTVPVSVVRLPGNPAVTMRDEVFAAAVTSMVHDEEYDEADYEMGEVEGEGEEEEEAEVVAKVGDETPVTDFSEIEAADETTTATVVTTVEETTASEVVQTETDGIVVEKVESTVEVQVTETKAE
ncbi:hypothetical protein HDU97_000432 [Phlyctochytrium planicorne]|nr:hypothetical protein HDU97_000432 [Phlyctochytrium planicorne]